MSGSERTPAPGGGPAPDGEGELIAAKLRRRYGLIAAVTVVLLVAGGGGIAYASWNAGVDQALVIAQEELIAAGGDLAEAITTGEDAWTASAGRVGDDQVRVDLRDVLTAAASVPTGVRQDGSRQDQTRTARDRAAAAIKARNQIQTATTSVTEAVTAWELARAVDGLDQALVELDAVVIAGEELLAGTEGQVADNAVRERLREVLDVAIGVRDQVVVRDEVVVVLAVTGQVRAAAGPLEATSTEVSGAHEAWQTAEAERIAAEQAAAAAAARQKTSTSGTGGNSKTGSKASGGASTPAAKTGGTGSSSAKPPRLGSNPGPNFGTGTAPACTTPSCGITF